MGAGSQAVKRQGQFTFGAHPPLAFAPAQPSSGLPALPERLPEPGDAQMPICANGLPLALCAVQNRVGKRGCLRSAFFALELTKLRALWLVSLNCCAPKIGLDVLGSRFQYRLPLLALRLGDLAVKKIPYHKKAGIFDAIALTPKGGRLLCLRVQARIEA